MKKSILLFTSLFFIMPLFGQQSVKGKETDDKNIPLPGVSVQVKNTLRGTFSDIDGVFSLVASPQDTLVISMVGMDMQSVPLQGRTTIDIKLLTGTTNLDEVVVIGYGSQKVKDMTAPIVTIKGDDLSKQLTSNVMQALQGKVAGVQIINSGIPGSGAIVKIRGVGSIGDYAKPLYVVDGVFVDNIDFLSSGDIEDLTILKDASASAIYGVRAANGAILVTTKKGKPDKPIIG